ncbi:MAG: hypothetical protein J6O50_06120 [Ruminiclostridium sp.]|nr:hypothetical protein [Ruminiclostridium sp.]MBO6301726.1 hypothetical protein [Ruminiclostridium sp.]
MKTYIKGIIIGIISILSSLLIVGIPIGTSPVEIVEIVILILGIVILLFMTLKTNNDTVLLAATATYVLTVFILTMIIELSHTDITVLAIGFIPGAAVGTVGLIRTIKNKSDHKITASLIINIIGIVASICSLCLVIPNGCFVM